MSTAQIVLILLSLLVSFLGLVGHLTIEYFLIKKMQGRFKLEDVLIISLLCAVPISNAFMLLSVLFRTWSCFDLNDKLTKYIRGEK